MSDAAAAGAPHAGRPTDPGTGDDTSADLFERYRRLLFSVSYDMLGSVADAEDCVQEAWIRWARDDRSGVANPKSYLVRIVTNVTLNRLRSARARRETYVGPWLPEPLITVPDVAEDAERADSVSYAMLVVLETLNPVERAVFVLREVFGVPHSEIAEAVGKPETTVRQVAHRAREHVHERRPRFAPDPDDRRRLTDAFLNACFGGDVEGLKDLLADDVAVVTDGGGKAKAALRPVLGVDKAARFLAAVGITYADFTVRSTTVNGAPGVALFDANGASAGVFVLEVAAGRITRVLAVRNPDKLARLRQDTGRGCLSVHGFES